MYKTIASMPLKPDISPYSYISMSSSMETACEYSFEGGPYEHQRGPYKSPIEGGRTRAKPCTYPSSSASLVSIYKSTTVRLFSCANINATDMVR